MSSIPLAPDSPRIVAIDTSGRVGSVALALGPQVVVEEHFSHTMRHAIELMPTVRRLCAQQPDGGWRPEQIDHLYASTGPGSFTGLRITIAIARALAQATGVKLVGVPTLDVLALNAPETATNVAVMLDAKRRQVFAARYVRRAPDRAEDAARRVGPFVRVDGPVLVEPAAFLRVAANDGPVHVLGEGVDYHRAAIFSAGVEVIEVPRDLWPARAANVHQLGYARAQRGDFTPPEALLPVYIRLAEAEEVWRKKHGVPV